MSATTAADLLVRAHHLARVVRDSHDPVDLEAWERFDVTLHRALHETIGTDATHIPRRDPHRAILLWAIRTYPIPLRPPAPTPLTPAQTAQLWNVSERSLRDRIRTGRLGPLYDGRVGTLDPQDVDRRPDITLADPADPHPLARLAVTLGALADLLHHARDTGQPALEAPEEAATAARHLLAIGHVAAARTLAAIPFTDADRPYAVAQYTERTLDALADLTTWPASLDRIRTLTPNPAPLELGDRLEAALDRWARAARADLTRPVPATEALRFLANQATHLYAVTHQVMTTDPTGSLDPDDSVTAALTAAARAARAVDPLWAKLTTLARPTLEYATASRALLPVLDDVTDALQAPSRQGLDTGRALADLTDAATTIAYLITTTRTLPERLARSQLLHTPKDRTTVADLHFRRRLLTRPATPSDVADLTQAWTHTGSTAHAAATQLHHFLDTRADHPLRALAPIERAL